MSYGANYKAGLAFQTSAGSWCTAVGSYHHLPLLTDDISLEKAILVSANLTGAFNKGAIYDGVNKVAGTIDMEATPKALGAILTAVINDATLVASGSFATRTFTPRTADWATGFPNHCVSYYKQFADASSGETFFDCQFSDIEFDIAAGQLLKVKATMVGGARLTGGQSLVVGTVPPEFSENWMWDVASVSYNGAGIGNFSDIAIKMMEQIDPLYTLNATLFPFKYTRKTFRDVTVDGTFYMSDRTIFNDFVAGTNRRLLVTLANSRCMVSSGYPTQLTLDVPNMKITTFKLAVAGPGEVAIKFSAMGVVDPTSSYAFQATLVSSYIPAY